MGKRNYFPEDFEYYLTDNEEISINKLYSKRNNKNIVLSLINQKSILENKFNSEINNENEAENNLKSTSFIGWKTFLILLLIGIMLIVGFIIVICIKRTYRTKISKKFIKKQIKMKKNKKINKKEKNFKNLEDSTISMQI